MIAADGAVGVLLFGLWVFCIIDVITTPEHQTRNLPKLAWLFIVIILVDLGSLAWLIAGRNWDGRGARPSNARYPEYERPGRHVAQNPDDDDAFLAQVRARADAQRRQYEERRRAERAAEDEALRRRRPPEPDDPR